MVSLLSLLSSYHSLNWKRNRGTKRRKKRGEESAVLVEGAVKVMRQWEKQMLAHHWGGQHLTCHFRRCWVSSIYMPSSSIFCGMQEIQSLNIPNRWLSSLCLKMGGEQARWCSTHYVFPLLIVALYRSLLSKRQSFR